jgi:hypothetical protein
MFNIGIAFEVLDDGASAPKGWSKVTGHIIWDVKMDFTRKARWVLDGHKQADPEGCTYAGVVSRESVRIALTYAALNGLEVYVRLTSAMPISRHHLPTKTTLYAAQSLEYNMRAR